jgi:hypothetical protein
LPPTHSHARQPTQRSPRGPSSRALKLLPRAPAGDPRPSPSSLSFPARHPRQPTAALSRGSQRSCLLLANMQVIAFRREVRPGEKRPEVVPGRPSQSAHRQSFAELPSLLALHPVYRFHQGRNPLRRRLESELKIVGVDLRGNRSPFYIESRDTYCLGISTGSYAPCRSRNFPKHPQNAARSIAIRMRNPNQGLHM